MIFNEKKIYLNKWEMEHGELSEFFKTALEKYQDEDDMEFISWGVSEAIFGEEFGEKKGFSSMSGRFRIWKIDWVKI